MGFSLVSAGLLVTGGLLLCPVQDGAVPVGIAQDGMARAAKAQDKVRFAAPVRLRAGEAFLGEGRYYPSPVLHDVDGDGKADVVVGDLFGKVTFAPRAAASKALGLLSEKPLEDRRGEQLKFHNW